MFAIWWIAGVVSVAAWIVAGVLPLGAFGWIAAGIVTLVAVVTAFLLHRRIRGGGGGRTPDLDAVVLAQMQSATQAQQVALQTLEEDFREAAQRMTGSVPGRAGTQAIDTAPWYLVLGPTGVGKSSLLAASGQPFAWATAASGPRGQHPCRWWVADEAVYVDTSGTWCASEVPAPEWLAFLGLTVKNRPTQPIQGVILTVAADALAGASNDDLDGLARIFRARLDEVVGYLGVDVPVHVVVTRVDMVPGFWEFFGDLRHDDRGQIWGTTLPVIPFRTSSISDRVGPALDELVAVLTARRLRRLATERDPVRRFTAFQFPQWFAGLRHNLVSLTAATFAPSVYQDPILLRGVYFATAASDPTSRDPSAGGAFARDLFRAVIVPDRDIATRSTAEAHRRRSLRNTLAASVATLAILTVILPGWSYVDNDALVTQLDAAVAGVSLPSDIPLPIASLDALRVPVVAMRDDRDNGPPLSARFGMYVGEALLPHAATLFGALTYRDVVAPIVARKTSELRAFVQRFGGNTIAPGPDERTYYADALRLYVFLTTPRMPDDIPWSDPAEKLWAKQHLAQAWAHINPTAQATAWQSMNAITDLYARLMESDARLASPRDMDLVARVRAVLAR